MFNWDFTFINEEFYAERVSPDNLDLLLAQGWRHFGAFFFRYSLGFYQNEIRAVQPLRVRLADFTRSKSQRRILRRNRDLQTLVRPIEIDAEKLTLFDRHKQRFKTGAPDSIYDFLDVLDAANVPCKTMEIAVYDKEKLLAASFFDVGANSISGVYALFEPTEKTRGLGIYTMLLEMDFAREHGRDFYYSGYAYEGSSFYDYKKRFAALETYDWKTGEWKKLSDK